MGYALLFRVESCLTATRAMEGQVECPNCKGIIERSLLPNTKRPVFRDEDLRCEDCGWTLPWAEYNKSYRGKKMGCAGLGTFFQEFKDKFPNARSYEAKMILIDTLIHRYHWELEGHPAGPGTAALLGGKMSDIMPFLRNLTYGENSTPSLKETYAHWEKIGEGIDWLK